jgi:hypothetical protein
MTEVTKPLTAVVFGSTGACGGLELAWIRN